MKYKYILLCCVALSVTTLVQAQQKSDKNAVSAATRLVNNYKDSLQVLRLKLDSVMKLNTMLRSEATDGRYYRLFAPTTFYHSGANRAFSLFPQADDDIAGSVDDVLMGLYLRRPDLVRFNETQLKKVGSLRNDVNREVIPQVELVDKVAPGPEIPDEVVPIAVEVKKPNFWKFKFDGSLQFLQNYVSDNWHKGGESNYSAVGSTVFQLNYNDKDRVTFDNKLEMKLGFQTSRSDTVHKFKPNNDILRYTGKLGLQAHKKWYYTLQLLAYTQFARGLKANDEKVYSDFMSPFDLNVGLGMEYKVEALNKRLKGSLNFAPLSYNFRYVDRLALSTSYGLKEGKHTLHDFGAQLTIDLEWKMAEQITWKSRLYGYTSYKRALVEWENLFTLQVSKYISANLFLYPRFDDSGKRDDGMGYFQFQEYSSLGISYNF
ncbi:MAG: DUF3078 domain-containing protein [Prevotella sp.]|nr:DUF3078 domain-containing protein [Prevotella sp.]